MPRQKSITFTIKRIQQGTTTVRESTKALLDLFKAEPEDEKRRNDLLIVAQAIYDAMEERYSGTRYPVPWYGSQLHSGFGRDDYSVLIICFAWLGMPEMCEMVRKSRHHPLPNAVFAELREPIKRSGGTAHYRAFLTAALSGQDNITELLHALDTLVDPPSETAQDPEAHAWSRQMIQTTLDSYSASRVMNEKDASILMKYVCPVWPEHLFPEVCLHPAPLLNEASDLASQCTAVCHEAC